MAAIILKESDLVLCPVERDGHCMLHCFAKYFKENVKDVSNRLKHHLDGNLESPEDLTKLKQQLDGYFSNKISDSNAVDYILPALGDIYECEIIIYRDNQKPLHLKHQNDARIIYLKLTTEGGSNHYDLLMERGANITQELEQARQRQVTFTWHLHDFVVNLNVFLYIYNYQGTEPLKIRLAKEHEDIDMFIARNVLILESVYEECKLCIDNRRFVALENFTVDNNTLIELKIEGSDGQGACCSLLAVVFGILTGFVCILLVCLSSSPSFDKFHFNFSYYMLSGAMFVSSVLMTIVLACKRKYCQKIEQHQDMFIVGSVFFFAIGYMFIDILLIGKWFHCALPWDRIIGKENKALYSSMILYHLVRLVFTILQLVFIQVFVGVKVQNNTWFTTLVKFTCMCGVATNLSIWCSTFFFEAKIFSSQDDEFNLNCTANPHDKVLETTTELVEYFQSFIMEFSLVAIIVYVGLFPSGCNVCLPSGSSHKNVQQKKCKKDYSKVFKVDVGLLIGIPFSLVYLLSTWNLKDNLHVTNNIIFNYVMEIITNCSIIGVFIYLCRGVLHEYWTQYGAGLRTLGAERFLLCIGGIAKIIFHFIIFVLSIMAWKSGDKKNDLLPIFALMLASALFSMVSAFIQSFVLLYLHNWKHLPVNTRQLRSRDRSAKVKQCLFFLMACNLSFWTTVSFFDLKDSSTKYLLLSKANIDKVWSYASKFLYPFVIFFHFHSLELMVHVMNNFLFDNNKKKTH